jgi:hypothetical protein
MIVHPLLQELRRQSRIAGPDLSGKLAADFLTLLASLKMAEGKSNM